MRCTTQLRKTHCRDKIYQSVCANKLSTIQNSLTISAFCAIIIRFYLCLNRGFVKMKAMRKKTSRLSKTPSIILTLSLAISLFPSFETCGIAFAFDFETNSDASDTALNESYGSIE